MPFMLTVICLSGLFLPKITMYVTFVNIVARIIYTIMYLNCGSDNRVIGVIAGSVPINILALTTVVFNIIEIAK